jgi:hypothetical protein
MRTNLFLLSAAFLLAACGDDKHPAAPTGPSVGAASRTVTDYPPGPSNAGKPAAQSGWTQAITVGATISVAPGLADFATALCPAGTTVVGGGFSLGVGAGTAPIVYLNNPNVQATGWNAGVQNLNPAGGSYVTVTSVARCAS